MRRLAFTVLGACALLACGDAVAGTKLSERTKFYSISARTGEALIAAMDRRGPRHGFMARAIAQTRYSIGWEFQWAINGGTCRMNRADAVLDITYTYPKATGTMTPSLQRRWKRFYAGVHAHEEKHGAIAREMVRAAEKSVKGVSVRRDPSCRSAQAEAKRRIERVYARYEAKQIAFDAREHRDGGNVEGLLRGLIGRK